MLAADKLLLQSTIRQSAISLKEKEFSLHHGNFNAVRTTSYSHHRQEREIGNHLREILTKAQKHTSAFAQVGTQARRRCFARVCKAQSLGGAGRHTPRRRAGGRARGLHRCVILREFSRPRESLSLSLNFVLCALLLRFAVTAFIEFDCPSEASRILKFCYYSSAIISLSSNILCVANTTFLSVWGTGLAMRGSAAYDDGPPPSRPRRKKLKGAHHTQGWCFG